MQITPNLTIDNSELEFSYVRSSGPGGQNVNKVATAVQLRFNIINSPSLPADVKYRLVRLVGKRISSSGDLVIEAKRFRSQEQNQADAEIRLANLIRKAHIKPKERKATRPTAASKERRIETKRHRGEIKRVRSEKKTTGSDD